MSSSVPLQVAETVQTAHLQRNPSPRHDVNPSTAASKREPIRLEPVVPGNLEDDDEEEEEEEEEDSEEEEEDSGEEEEAEALELELEDDEEDETETEDESLYRSRVRPSPRRHHLPPMPDLRFQQSYLSSIRNADTWWKVAWITVRDQVMMPFMQGIVYNLAIFGWRHWNRNARIHGSSVGARLRRWWYGMRGWPIPPERKVDMHRKAW